MEIKVPVKHWDIFVILLGYLGVCDGSYGSAVGNDLRATTELNVIIVAAG